MTLFSILNFYQVTQSSIIYANFLDWFIVDSNLAQFRTIAFYIHQLIFITYGRETESTTLYICTFFQMPEIVWRGF